MDPFQISAVEAIFKMIEERVPFGRFFTTVAAILTVLATIVFTGSYLAAKVAIVLGLSTSPFHLGPISLSEDNARFLRSTIGFLLGIGAGLAPMYLANHLRNRDAATGSVVEAIRQLDTRLNAVERKVG